MDPSPPLPPIPTTITTTAAAITNHLNSNNQDSVDSSPRSRPTDTWDNPLPPVPGSKLRLMCSYGGHIIPRPHDKSLCYVGGDTRIVVADRHSALSDLCSRLSHTLLHGRHFTLKYQLPNEELDSLVSITTDEDLENMIEEYDRLTTSCTSPLKPARLRLFLFPSKPETAASMGSLLDDAKSETWFVDALNGTGFLPRGLSDSATMDNNLLELDDGVVNDHVKSSNTENNPDVEVQNELPTQKRVKTLQDVHSNMPDSPIVETNSSFGSSSSSPTMSNLPPIRVRVGVGEDESCGRLYDQMAGLDEHLSHMSVGVGVGVAVPPLPVIIGGAQAMVTTGMGNSNMGQSENSGRVLSEDERSDHGAATGFRKPPLPLQPVPRKLGHDPYALPSPDSKQAEGCNLTSPDSVTSDGSIVSASFSKHAQYQDQTQVSSRETRTPSPQTFPTANFPDPTNSDPDNIIYTHPVHQNQHHQQQQFYHTNTHYIHHPGNPNPVPISSYYPVYATSSQQQQPQQHYQQVEPPYQIYYMPVPQNQPYNHPIQSDATNIVATLPLYPSKTPPPPPTTKTSEMVANTPYRTTTPTLVQVPSNQYQTQYMNMPFAPHYPPTPQAYEYGQQTHEQANCYPVATAVPSSQYQTMTSATALMLSQASAQQQQTAENAKQQIGTAPQL